MEGTTGIQPTYNLADRGYSDGFGFGGGSGIWLFAILALMWGGNGLFGGRGQMPQDYARQSDVVYTSAFNQLQLQNAVAGVIRYPNQTTYSSGVNPFCGCGYGNI